MKSNSFYFSEGRRKFLESSGAFGVEGLRLYGIKNKLRLLENEKALENAYINALGKTAETPENSKELPGAGIYHGLRAKKN